MYYEDLPLFTIICLYAKQAHRLTNPQSTAPYKALFLRFLRHTKYPQDTIIAIINRGQLYVAESAKPSDQIRIADASAVGGLIFSQMVNRTVRPGNYKLAFDFRQNSR